MTAATERGIAALVLTFEPHPRTIFKPEAPVFRLTPLPAKARILTAVGLDGLDLRDDVPGLGIRIREDAMDQFKVIE